MAERLLLPAERQRMVMEVAAESFAATDSAAALEKTRLPLLFAWIHPPRFVAGRFHLLRNQKDAAMKNRQNTLVLVLTALIAAAAVSPLPPSLAVAATKKDPEAEAATRQINNAVAKARETREFKKASVEKDYKTMAMILRRYGAPEDTVVSGDARGIRITITCCTKKPWGPVIIVI